MNKPDKNRVERALSLEATYGESPNVWVHLFRKKPRSRNQGRVGKGLVSEQGLEQPSSTPGRLIEEIWR